MRTIKEKNKMTLLKSFIKISREWWYDLDTVFDINISFSLSRLIICVIILGFKLKFEYKLPDFTIPCISFCWEFERIINKNKAICINVCSNNNLFTGIFINKSMHCDHAGYQLNFYGIFFSVYVNLYDGRHWDYDNNRWEIYNDDGTPILKESPVYTEEEFNNYFIKWRDETSCLPVEDKLTNDNYYSIVRMKWEGIPYIIKQLHKEPYYLCDALWYITRADVVKSDHINNIPAMAQDWINWWEEYKNKDH